MTDGGLRQIFQKFISDVHFQSIETWSTGQGVPDLHYCLKYNRSGWIEMKQTKSNAVVVRPEQVAWAERHWRVGGRVFFAVRKKADGGKRRVACDELYLIHGEGARYLKKSGISGVRPGMILGKWSNGPRSWDWTRIRDILAS